MKYLYEIGNAITLISLHVKALENILLEEVFLIFMFHASINHIISIDLLADLNDILHFLFCYNSRPSDQTKMPEGNVPLKFLLYYSYLFLGNPLYGTVGWNKMGYFFRL